MDDIEALGSGLAGVPVAAVLNDLATGAVIAVNAAAVELLGRPAVELIGTDVILFVHPDERTVAGDGVAALASGAVDAVQVRNRRVVRSEGAAMAVDISGRRVEAENRRLALWVFAPTGQESALGPPGLPGEVVLAVTDHDWQLEYVSADGRLLGPAREVLIGTALLGLVHPSAAAEFLEAASRAVAHRITVSLVTRLRSGKDAWTERKCLLVPMCDHHPPRLGLVFTAITAITAITATATASGDAPTDVIATHMRHTAVDTRAADALGTLAAMTASPGFPELSARQIEILSKVVRGDAVDDIAGAIFLSPSTVRNHLTALYRRFGVHSRAGLLTELLRMSSAPAPKGPGAAVAFRGPSVV